MFIRPESHIDSRVARGKKYKYHNEGNEAIHYFDLMLPRLKKNEGSNMKFIEGVQHPGETIFVPGNWWHAVLNLDDTIAITQNFFNEGNFDVVWKRTREERKRLSVKLLE